MAELTLLLYRVQEGDREAEDALMSAVYEELRVMAHRQLRQHARDGTLNTTALVHEAYLKLFGGDPAAVEGRAHFYALAARAMRQVLVDSFRRRKALKRGSGRALLPLQEGLVPIEDRGEVIHAIDDAINGLAELNERLARVVEYKFFGGLTQEQIASVLGLSPRTIASDWKKAKAWLALELGQYA